MSHYLVFSVPQSPDIHPGVLTSVLLRQVGQRVEGEASGHPPHGDHGPAGSSRSFSEARSRNVSMGHRDVWSVINGTWRSLYDKTDMWDGTRKGPA
mgnify:CR=1 FL=1